MTSSPENETSQLSHVRGRTSQEVTGILHLLSHYVCRLIIPKQALVLKTGGSTLFKLQLAISTGTESKSGPHIDLYGERSRNIVTSSAISQSLKKTAI